MNENINLCEILKGHEGETFYSPLYGNIILDNIEGPYSAYPLSFKRRVSKMPSKQTFTSDGKPVKYCAECLIFPSKDQRDWNKWLEEQNSKVPKTWSELVEYDRVVEYNLEATYKARPNSTSYTPIEKSALALLKIFQLIEVGYGGNITKEEWKDTTTCKFTIVSCYSILHGFEFAIHSTTCIHNIAFHTKEQAEEFLSKPENVELVKDYFMI